MRRQIHWEYWQNPFDEINEWISEKEAKLPKEWDEDEDLDIDPSKIRPCLGTSMGFLPITPYYKFGKHWQFWMGHTNFPITKKVRKIIDEVPGVEILDVYTRYRFRVGPGRQFKWADVRVAIEEALDAIPPRRGEINPTHILLPKDVRQKLDLLEKQANENYDMWSMYVMPNGEIDFAASNTKEGHDMHLELYKSAQESAGGVIIASDSK